MIRVNISLANATVTETETLTAGRVGLECAFTFSSEWDGLSKVAVFEGAETIEVALGTANVAVVPPECMATAGYSLRVGAYGLSAANAIVIPTIWAKAGKIKDSAAPDDESFAPATPELVAQIIAASEDALEMARNVKERADSGAFDGEPGQDGISPTVLVEEIEGGHRATITDAGGEHIFDVMDGTNGTDGEGVPASGTTGQYLRKKSNTDYDTEWGSPPAEVYWATYGTTTSAEIEAAYNAGKVVLCLYNSMVHVLSYRGNSTTHTFTVYMNSSGYYVRCSSDVWANGSISLAPVNSPSLTGTPKAPTAAAGTDTTQIATTAFVQGELDGVHQVPAGGSSGYVLKKASGTDYDLEWAAESGGGGGVTVDDELSDSSTNPVQNKVIKAALDGKGTYSKPSGGIPSTDLASAVQASLGKADTALQSAPVTSVNGQTGAVSLSIPSSASDVGAEPAVTEETVSTAGSVTKALDAGKIYHFTGALTALTITLNAAPAGQIAHYHFDFNCGSTAPTVTIPNTVTMPSGAFEASKHYEVDILNNYGAVMAWATS